MSTQAISGTVVEIIEGVVDQHEIKHGHIAGGAAEGMQGTAEPGYVAKVNGSSRAESTSNVQTMFFEFTYGS